MELIRVWKNIPVGDIDSHLLIVDDLSGFCQNCKTPGIKYTSGIDTCPNCGTQFLYVSTRESNVSTVGLRVLQRLFELYPGLSVIDYQDYKHLSDKKKAHNLFSE